VSPHRVRIPLAELGPDGRAVVATAHGEIAVIRAGGAIYAIENECPHATNPLVEGDLVGTTLVCVYHGWRFDLGSGACLHGEEPVRSYPVAVEGDEIVVDLGP
jgi:3-phenylpropionate/trans-cinnamate dioxygenase ferredoxin subunit